MDFTNGEFTENQQRVESLIKAAETLSGEGLTSTPISQDVLRAAVVFLHSSLEEVIRNLYLLRLPNVAPEKLNNIPLASHSPTQRPSKIFLGHLVQFRGKFVENVIAESIEAYVDTFNLNNTTELHSCLEFADINASKMRAYFPDLNNLMKRRHQIVHQMDRTNELDPLCSPLSPIDLGTVKQWKSALEHFVGELFVAYTEET